MAESPTERPNYEQARAELVEVVQKLESGRVPLAESMALWERGEELARVCQDWLDGARAKVEQARAQSSRGDDDPGRAQPDAQDGVSSR